MKARSLTTWLCVAAIVATVVPIVAAAVRALTGHWIPIGDDALLPLRARDVFSAHPPLLGSWSSSSTASGVNVNNPGPLFFFVLAVPVRLFDRQGIFVGM